MRLETFSLFSLEYLFFSKGVVHIYEFLKREEGLENFECDFNSI